MNILDKIYQLRQERNWTEYQLSVQSDLPQSTISSWYKKNMLPSITSLQKICDGFGISMAYFFSEGENDKYADLTQEQKELLDEWTTLTSKQKEQAKYFIKCLKE